MGRVWNLLKLPLNSERFTLWNFRRSNSTGLKKLTESYVVSDEKLKKEFGIQNLPVDAMDGLLKTFGSFNIRRKSDLRSPPKAFGVCPLSSDITSQKNLCSRVCKL